MPWVRTIVFIYGQQVELLIRTRTCLYYTVCGTRLVRVVLTRDPKGKYEDRAYFSTLTDEAPEEILKLYAKRWTIEVTYYNCKQHLGLEQPQNGWNKRTRSAKTRRKRKRQAENAVRRTVPIIFIVHALVYLWYFENGDPVKDVELVKGWCPWYTSKTEVSFADMLCSIRWELLLARISKHPELERVQEYFQEAFEDGLITV